MNYFEFFGIPVSFFPDEKALRASFLKNSKAFHPDFFTLASEEKQAEILEKSSLNNTAYKILSDFDKRLYYILELSEQIEAEGKNQIPQAFLMEMMDINEALMEIQMDPDAEAKEKITTSIEQISQKLYQEIEKDLQSFDPSANNEAALSRIKDYYFKSKYLNRLRENLEKI